MFIRAGKSKPRVHSMLKLGDLAFKSTPSADMRGK
ncbi:hypothetical protein AZ54_15065 [Xanthomonas oryzae pv. oryzae PXO86]|nr:hypothetical protein AZ54_15065 [Xanthomonas oryzae pv. oryzae PXO86]